MDLNHYQKQAIEFAATHDLANYALGIAGEAGEVADLIKKHLHHGHVLHHEELVRELGDVLWYVSGMAYALGFELSDVADANLTKLRKRYPEGYFTPERSQNRAPGDK